MNKREIGEKYEGIALKFLEKKGFIVRKKNFYGKKGEIDLIAMDGDFLCFIEVKYRASDSHGHPLESITPRKIMTISKTAQEYILKNNIPQSQACRFDVVAIFKKEITLIKNAFDGI